MREIRKYSEAFKLQVLWELESALSDAHLDLRLEQAYVELACEAVKIKDIEGSNKKHVGKRVVAFDFTGANG